MAKEREKEISFQSTNSKHCSLSALSIAYLKQLQSPTNSFVMSLAVADCLVGLLVMPYSMIRTMEGCWYFGVLLCQLHSSLDVMLCTASIFHLSCIAFDRYYPVCNPLLYLLKITRGRVALLIVICWAIPTLISFGPIMLDLHIAGVDIPLPGDVCVFLVNRIYAVMASLVAFYLPMAIMLIAYWIDLHGCQTASRADQRHGKPDGCRSRQRPEQETKTPKRDEERKKGSKNVGCHHGSISNLLDALFYSQHCGPIY